jgi:type VI secretion system protein VasG
MIALKQTPEFARQLHEMSGEFIKINGDILSEQFIDIVKNSGEVSAPAAVAGSQGKGAPAAAGSGDALQLYTVDISAAAAAGKCDPVTGRDVEIRKIINILMRRRQNNPILTGDAGVGKTAIVEGFAQRLASGDIPESLKGTRLLSLDLGLLQAGAGMKGEFENRLKQVIEGAQNSENPVILFIDEAHTLIGAGGQAGQNDAANLLKPALARGLLRCIAATTYQEYIKYFEKDPALARRFQNIIIDEPDDETAVAMLRGIAGGLEAHHKVNILDEAFDSAVKLSRRYLPVRCLPDKAVGVLDAACAKVALSQNAEPAELEYCRRKIDSVKLEINILQREETGGISHEEKLAALEEELKSEEAKKEELEKRTDTEKALAADIGRLREEAAASQTARQELKEKRQELSAAQGDDPLVFPQVDSQTVSAVISEWTGIPLGRMMKNEIQSILTLDKELQKRVIGQNYGLEMIAKRITTARASLADPNKPIAVIMLAGPSGTGKTETALSLAEQIYGSEENIITINMSEFQEAYTVSTLKGAPPGYVGYGEGGVLTEAVRRKPYSVLLLDEVEKAHPDVHEIFFQVFDKGQMEDGSGRLINFRNTIIILTTNVGDTAIANLCVDENNLPGPAVLEEAIRPAMMRTFPAALLGRLQIVPYYPLGKEVLCDIIELKLDRIKKRVATNYKAELEISSAVNDEIIRRCDNAASGARLIDAVINNNILPEISAMFLHAVMEKEALSKVFVDVSDQKFVYNEEKGESEDGDDNDESKDGESKDDDNNDESKDDESKDSGGDKE